MHITHLRRCVSQSMTLGFVILWLTKQGPCRHLLELPLNAGNLAECEQEVTIYTTLCCRNLSLKMSC